VASSDIRAESTAAVSSVIDKGEMFRQVLLSRPIENGRKDEVCWIDNDIAKVGKRVRTEDGIEWTIVATYNAKHFADVDSLRSTWKRFAEVLDGH
jgi:hypothetical protein